MNTGIDTDKYFGVNLVISTARRALLAMLVLSQILKFWQGCIISTSVSLMNLNIRTSRKTSATTDTDSDAFIVYSVVSARMLI